MRLSAVATLPALVLAACQQQAEPRDQLDHQTIALDELKPRQANAFPSPDTEDAAWTVDANGKAIHFGNVGTKPFLSLDCVLDSAAEQIVLIRHAQAWPGQSALFPVYGNGVISRFFADTRLTDGQWRWESTVSADDPMLDVFTGPREITATLPGRGTLKLHGSRIPGEFVTWCRNGGRAAA